MSKQKQEGGNKRDVTQSKDKLDKQSKSKYYTHIQPYLGAIAAMMRAGATMEIIAEKFKVSKPTLYSYMDIHPNFFDAIKTNAEIADFAVENALYKKACEGDNVAMIFWLKNRSSKRWRDKQHVFQASTTVTRKDWELMSDEELEKEAALLENAIPTELGDEETEGELH